MVEIVGQSDHSFALGTNFTPKILRDLKIDSNGFCGACRALRCQPKTKATTSTGAILRPVYMLIFIVIIFIPKL